MKCLFHFSYSGNFHEALNDATAAFKLEPTSIKALETGKILHSIDLYCAAVDSHLSELCRLKVLFGTGKDRNSSISSIVSVQFYLPVSAWCRASLKLQPVPHISDSELKQANTANVC